MESKDDSKLRSVPDPVGSKGPVPAASSESSDVGSGKTDPVPGAQSSGASGSPPPAGESGVSSETHTDESSRVVEVSPGVRAGRLYLIASERFDPAETSAQLLEHWKFDDIEFSRHGYF